MGGNRLHCEFTKIDRAWAREEGENTLHILLPPTPFSSLASNKTMSHMVEYTVPDEFTVSIPPRMDLVLIVCTCTHCGKPDSFAEK